MIENWDNLMPSLLTKYCITLYLHINRIKTKNNTRKNKKQWNAVCPNVHKHSMRIDDDFIWRVNSKFCCLFIFFCCCWVLSPTGKTSCTWWASLKCRFFFVFFAAAAVVMFYIYLSFVFSSKIHFQSFMWQAEYNFFFVLLLFYSHLHPF